TFSCAKPTPCTSTATTTSASPRPIKGRGQGRARGACRRSPRRRGSAGLRRTRFVQDRRSVQNKRLSPSATCVGSFGSLILMPRLVRCVVAADPPVTLCSSSSRSAVLSEGRSDRLSLFPLMLVLRESVLARYHFSGDVCVMQVTRRSARRAPDSAPL